MPLYAGTEPHRFTGIWMVVADGRAYVRSWKIRGERSWHEDLARHRIGAIILDRHEITIESQPIESRHALDKVDTAYREKYGDKWLSYVEDMVSPRSRRTTMELLSSPGHPRENELRPLRG